MPRLLIPIVSALRGGAEEYAADIAGYASGNGFDVHVLLSGLPSMDEFADELARRNVTIHRMPVEEAGGPRVWMPRLFRGLRLNRAIAAIDPDVAMPQIPGIRYGAGIVRLCVELGVPCCPVFHLINWDQWSRTIARRWSSLLSHPLVTAIVVSESNRERLLESTGVSPDRIVAIHTGVDIERFSVSEAGRQQTRQKLRASLGVADDALVALGVGRLDHQKGCDVLNLAIPKLRQSHPNLRFLWAGEGPLRASLEKDARTMGTAESLHLLGRRTDVPDLLAAADVFVFPSRLEGFPFALLEAMAANVPVVASDIPAVREAVGPEDAAVLVPPDDVYHLRRGITNALDDPDAARRRAAAAFTRVHQFSKRDMCRKTLDLVRSCQETVSHA